MFEKPTAEHVVGVEWEDREIRVAVLGRRRQEPVIERLFTFEIAENTSHPLLQTKEGQELLKLAKDHLIITGLGQNELLIRQLEIKLKKIRDIPAVLPFQAEPLLPFPVEQALLDSLPRGESADSTLLTLVAARRDYVERHLEQLQQIDLDPEVIGAIPVALAAFGSFYSHQQQPYYHLHIGSSSSIGLLIEEGRLIASQSVPVGWNTLAQAYLKDGGDKASLEEQLRKRQWLAISETEWPHLSGAWRGFNREITRLLLALGKHHRGKIIDNLFVTGAGGYGTAAETLAKQLDKTYLVPLGDAVSLCSSQDLQHMAVSIGLALTGLPKGSDQVNFRQKELAYTNPWKRLKLPLLLYFLITSLLAFAIYLYGSAYQGARLDGLRQDYVQLLGSMQRDYPSIEAKARQRSTLVQGVSPETPPLVKSLSADEISDRLSILENELQANPDTMALYPNLPRISDFLAWLESLPQVVENQDDRTKSLISLESFSYTLVRRPEISKRQERYQAKVEISFSSSSPRAARIFHDALVAPNPFIDLQQDVKWTNDRTLYRATFFLKDRTRYP